MKGSLKTEEDFMESLDEEDIKQKMAIELFNSNENLSAKTELTQVIKWTLLETMEHFIKKHKLNKSAETLEKFRKTAFTNNISLKRQGRKEYVQMVNALSFNASNIEDKTNAVQTIKPIK